MTTPSPSEQINSAIYSLQTKVGWMQDSVRIKPSKQGVLKNEYHLDLCFGEGAVLAAQTSP